MPRLAVQDDVVATVAYYLSHGLVQIQLAPVLIKVTGFQVDPPLDRPRIGLQFAKQQLQ